MAQVRDFLDRFRPAGAPGAAQAGVPADRVAEREAELQPVLALLDGVRSECERIIEEAHSEAASIAAAARDEAVAIEAEAARRARSARDDAAQELLDQASRQARDAVVTAGRQAAQVRRLARRHMPELVAVAVGLVSAEPEGPWTPMPGQPS